MMIVLSRCNNINKLTNNYKNKVNSRIIITKKYYQTLIYHKISWKNTSR